MAAKEVKANWKTGLRLLEYVGGQGAVDDLNAAAKIEFYDQNAESYDQDMAVYGATNGPKHAASALHKFLKGNLNNTILDVGAGTGLVIKELQALAPYNNADALDASDGMLAVAKQRGLYNQVFTQYFTVNSGIEHDSYDVVVACGAMLPGHIEVEAIREMCDIAKPGGYAVLVGKQCHFQLCPSYRQLMPMVQQMVKQQKIVIAEYTKHENYSPGHEGFTLVLQKL